MPIKRLSTVRLPRRDQLPQWPFKIDTDNPLTAGLVSCVVFAGAGARDIAKAGRLPTTPGNLTTQLQGVAVDTFTLANPAGDTSIDFTSGSWTVATWGILSAALGASSGRDFYKKASYVSEANNQGWSLTAQNDGNGNNFRFVSFDNNGNASYNLLGTTAPSAGLWHIAGTSNGTTRRLYVNGTQEATTTNNPNPVSTTSGIQGTGSPGFTLVGMAWNRELSAGEIAYLYNVMTRWELFIGRAVPAITIPPPSVVYPIPPSVGAVLQPSAIDPSGVPSSLRMSDIIRTVPPPPDTWLPYFSAGPFIQPADISGLNVVRISQPIRTVPVQLTYFPYFSQSGPLLPADLPPTMLRMAMQEYPFLYSAPGWLLSSPAVQLRPVDLPRPRHEIVQPVIISPVVYPQGLVTIPRLDPVQLPQWVISRPPFPIPPPPPVIVGCNLILSDLRQRCWERLDDDGTYYPAEMVRNALNFAQRLFCLLTLAIEKTTTFSLSANQAFYQISSQISDFMVPLRVSYNGIRVRTARLGDLNRKGAWSKAIIGVSGAPSTITHYAQFGMDGLAIYPSLPGTGTLTLVYSAIPADLIADTDFPVIPPEQQEHLIDLAIWLLRLPEGNVEGTTLTKEYLDRFVAATTKYASYMRNRNISLGFDHIPLDLDLTDLSALHRK